MSASNHNSDKSHPGNADLLSELLAKCDWGLDELTFHCRHRDPGNETLPQRIWDQVFDVARKLPLLQETVRELESRELNAGDPVEVVRRLSRLRHDVILAQGIVSPGQCNLARLDLEAFSRSSEEMISSLRDLICVRHHETIDDGDAEYVAAQLNVLFDDRDRRDINYALICWDEEADDPLRREMASILEGTGTVTAGRWQRSSGIDLLEMIAGKLEDEICIELECAGASPPRYGVLGLLDGFPMDMSDNTPGPRASARKIQEHWQAVRAVLYDVIPEDDDLVYLRRRLAEEHLLLRMKQAEYLKAGSTDGSRQGVGHQETNVNVAQFLERQEVNAEGSESLSGADAPEAYLGLRVDLTRRAVTRNGTRQLFRRKLRAWEMFVALYEAGEDGMTRQQLFAEIWDEKEEPRAENNFDKQKPVLNGILAPLGVEVAPINWGRWRLAVINIR